MRTTARGGGGATKIRRTTGTPSNTTNAAATQPIPDLPGLRARLAGARRRLIERIADDWTDDRRFPDSAWCRMLSDVEGCIRALDAVVAEGGP